jgi:D-inositol-3-phosphate glycosyltransferase
MPVTDPPSKNLRVLMVTSQSAGGIWQYACSLATALANIGSLQVAVAAPFPFEPMACASEVTVWSLGAGSRSAAAPRRVGRHLDKVRRLHRIIARFRPQIVHFHDRFGLLDFAYFSFLRSLGVRIVYTAHEVRSIHGKSGWFDRARYHEADAVLVHSRNGVTDLLGEGIDESKIVRVPHANYLHLNSAAPTAFQAKSLLRIPPGGRSVLFFGFIAPYKGLSVLIEAVSQLCKDDPDVYLIIAGKPIVDFKPYQRQIEESKLVGRVISDLRYVPFDEFGKFFAAADVVALPYRRIYQSGVLQLAYAFGKPVVVTDVGGLGDTVAEDATGLVAPTEDAHGLASALREILSSPARAQEMGDRGRRLAATKYSWDSVARDIAGLYRFLRRTPRRPLH